MGAPQRLWSCDGRPGCARMTFEARARLSALLSVLLVVLFSLFFLCLASCRACLHFIFLLFFCVSCVPSAFVGPLFPAPHSCADFTSCQTLMRWRADISV